MKNLYDLLLDAWDKLGRMSDWLLWAVLLAGLVWLVAPQNLGVMAYKLSLVSMAGILGYWLDRRLFPYARPHEYFTDGSYMIGALCMLRRALVVAAAMIGVTLGL